MGNEINMGVFAEQEVKKAPVKKTKSGKYILIGIIVFLLLIVRLSLFTVGVKQYAAVRQFGKIVRVEQESGLKFRAPFIQSVQKLSAATKIYDIPASDVITKDKKSMIADNYVLWRISDPKKYLQTLNGIDSRAMERIEAAVYNATKSVISSMDQDAVIAARGDSLTKMITEKSDEAMDSYGIEILRSEIKALDLPNDNKEAVYERMISERGNIAASYTAEGSAEAQKIRNSTDKEVRVMKAEAEKQAEITVAEGEAEYMKTLKEAYDTEDEAEFYNYLRSLDALRNSLTGENTIILDKDSEIAKILYGMTN